jgi:hypothetical protein
VGRVRGERVEGTPHLSCSTVISPASEKNELVSATDAVGRLAGFMLNSDRTSFCADNCTGREREGRRGGGGGG